MRVLPHDCLSRRGEGVIAVLYAVHAVVSGAVPKEVLGTLLLSDPECGALQLRSSCPLLALFGVSASLSSTSILSSCYSATPLELGPLRICYGLAKEGALVSFAAGGYHMGHLTRTGRFTRDLEAGEVEVREFFASDGKLSVFVGLGVPHDEEGVQYIH